MPDREAILDNAKYLRNVRPIDPEEIREYVADQPHPAVVRRVLREAAVDLGVVEREDGTFVPVEESPAPRPELPVESFPERYQRVLEDRLVETYGPDWHRGESGDGLRETLRNLKRAYHRGWDVDYGEREALTYAIYHLPDYYAAVQYVLDELAEVDLLGRSLRVCDVGAGVGGPALGVHDALPDDALVGYDAVEPAAGADLLEALLDETGRNFHAEVHRTTAEAFEGPDAVAAGERPPYDLVLFGNVLSELDDPIRTARRYLDALADDGALVLLAPADRHTSRLLRVVERALADGRVPEAYATAPTETESEESAPEDSSDESSEGEEGAADEEEDNGSDAAPGEAVPADVDEAPANVDEVPANVDEVPADVDEDVVTDRATVFSPTVRLWPGEAPADEGWSFVARPDLAVPAAQERLDEAGAGDGEFVNVDVQYSYAILRRDDERRIEYRPDRSRFATLAESERHVTDRVDCLAVKLSGDLADGGNPLYRVGDGSERADHFAVLTRETALNDDLREAAYGDLLTFESVLVLWNEDEGAVNLVVDDETIVDVAPAPVR